MNHVAIVSLTVALPLASYVWGRLQWHRGFLDAHMLPDAEARPRQGARRSMTAALDQLAEVQRERDALRAEVDACRHEIEVQAHLADRSLSASESVVTELRAEVESWAGRARAALVANRILRAEIALGARPGSVVDSPVVSGDGQAGEASAIGRECAPTGDRDVPSSGRPDDAIARDPR